MNTTSLTELLSQRAALQSSSNFWDIWVLVFAGIVAIGIVGEVAGSVRSVFLHLSLQTNERSVEAERGRIESEKDREAQAISDQMNLKVASAATANEELRRANLELYRKLAPRSSLTREQFAEITQLLISLDKKYAEKDAHLGIDFIMFNLSGEVSDFTGRLHESFRQANWDSNVWQVRGTNFVSPDIEISFRDDKKEWATVASAINDELNKLGLRSKLDAPFPRHEGPYPKGISEMKDVDANAWEPDNPAPIRMFIGEKSDMLPPPFP